MDKEFEKALKALCKKHGVEMNDRCDYCDERCHEAGDKQAFFVSFYFPYPEE
jgi:hypothetical protein